SRGRWRACASSSRSRRRSTHRPSPPPPPPTSDPHWLCRRRGALSLTPRARHKWRPGRASPSAR
ncbi:unnamed protein product, partial [Ectocarpus sp. 8 AP-2014]